MKRTEFRLLPVPAEVFDELGFTEDMTLEAFVEGRRLVLQRRMRKTHSVRGMMRTARVVPIAVPAAANA